MSNEWIGVLLQLSTFFLSSPSYIVTLTCFHLTTCSVSGAPAARNVWSILSEASSLPAVSVSCVLPDGESAGVSGFYLSNMWNILQVNLMIPCQLNTAPVACYIACKGRDSSQCLKFWPSVLNDPRLGFFKLLQVWKNLLNHLPSCWLGVTCGLLPA